MFGAGKTLSAAAMIAGLLVMDPTLQIMIVTKENVAACAFAKHFLRLGLPDSINSLVGRLVGYVELQKGPANKTDLDVPPAFRNDVLRSKKVLSLDRTHLHLADVEAFWPTVRHAINFVRPLT